MDTQTIIKLKIQKLEVNFKKAAGCEDPGIIAKAQANFKLALAEIFQVFTKINAFAEVPDAIPAADDLKKEISELKAEVKLQENISELQAEKIIQLESAIAAKNEIISKQAKVTEPNKKLQAEKIVLLESANVAKDEVISKQAKEIVKFQAECKAKDDSIALLTAERDNLDDFVNKQLAIAQELKPQVFDELEVRVFQVNQYIRRTRLLSATIENLKFEKGACFMNLANAKELLKKSSEVNKTLNRRVTKLAEELESSRKSRHEKEKDDSYDRKVLPNEKLNASATASIKSAPVEYAQKVTATSFQSTSISAPANTSLKPISGKFVGKVVDEMTEDRNVLQEVTVNASLTASVESAQKVTPPPSTPATSESESSKENPKVKKSRSRRRRARRAIKEPSEIIQAFVTNGMKVTSKPINA